MSFCPVCKFEYVQGIDRCPDCDVELVDKIDDEVTVPEKDLTGEELVSVFQSNDVVEVAIVKDMLKASGISVAEQPGMTFYGRGVDAAQRTSIYVFKSQADEAVKLIEQTGSEPEDSAEMDESV